MFSVFARSGCDCLFFFFFFQAEDGIRDWSVTGVQTCALPISMEKKEIGGVYVIPPDYVAAGKITAYSGSESIFSEGKLAQVPLRRLLIKSLAADAVSPEVVKRILSPVDIKTLSKRPDGTWVERGL